jgi:hypothetical protein
MNDFINLDIGLYIDELKQAAMLLATQGRYAHGTTGPGRTMDEALAQYEKTMDKGMGTEEHYVLAVDHPLNEIDPANGNQKEFVYAACTGNGPNSLNNALYFSYLAPGNVLAMINYIESLEKSLHDMAVTIRDSGRRAYDNIVVNKINATVEAAAE